MDAADENTTQQGRPRTEDGTAPGQKAPETLIIGRDPRARQHVDDHDPTPSEHRPQPSTLRPRFRAAGWALLAAAVGAVIVLAGLSALAAETSSEWRRCPNHASAQSQTEQLRRLINDEHEALVAADTKRLETLLAPEFTQVTPDGEVLRRDDLIAAVGSGELDFRSIRTDHSNPAGAVQVVLDCDVATASYRSEIDVASNPFHVRHDAQHTETWVRNSGTWHKVHAQTTAVGGFPPPGQ